MFSKSTVFTAAIMALGLLIRSCSAGDSPPPACVITCLNGAGGSLNDLKYLCSEPSVQPCLSSSCGSDKDQAMKVYSETCKTGGYEIVLVSSSSSSASASATTTDNLESFPSVTADPTATPTASGSGAPTSTSTTGSASSSLSVTGYAFALIVAAAGILL